MPATRQLAAIMFTDMVGYTALMQENEQLALQRRDRNQKIFEAALQKFGGKLLQFYGDGTLSIFTSAVNSIQAAIEMQTLCRRDHIELRIGIHIGDVITDDNGIYGDSVNIASRIESLAVPGSIFISEKLYDDVKNHEGISARPLGFFELKNVKQPIQVFAISNEGIVIPSRDEVKGKVKQTLNSIAVLPFSSLSSDPENEFFCDGITEELLNVLAKMEGLQVTSRTSSFAFKGKNEDVREIAGKLNVQKVLEGSVRKAGNRVRITAQLINASDGYHLWSETYDRSLEDIFAVQDDIAREIANKFRVNLSESDYVKPIVEAPTENMEAYKKYLLGLHLWNKQTIEAIFKALAAFNEAAAMDPSFINPQMQIININAFFTHAAFITVEEGKKICTEALDHIMKVNPQDPWALMARGLVTFYFEWDLDKGEHYFKQALEKSPNLANAWLYLAWGYALKGKNQDMLQAVRNAHRLDPLGGDTLAGSAEVCFIAGMLDEAEHYCHDALELNPHNIYATSVLAMVTGVKGDWKKAEDLLLPVYEMVPDFNLVIAFMGFILAKNDQRDEALQIINKLEEKQSGPGAPSLDLLIAMVHIGLGNRDEFYARYNESIRNRIVTCMYYYRSPIMNDVRGEERMKAIGERLHLN